MPEEDRSAQASSPHSQMQRLSAYHAQPERSAPPAQRRCGLNILDIVLYYHFTLWIHAVAPQLGARPSYHPYPPP